MIRPARDLRSAHPTARPSARLALRLTALAIAASLGCAAWAQSPAVDIDLPAAPLERSLATVAREADVQVVFASALAEGKTAPALKGRYTPREALERLLAGQGLVLRAQDDRTFTVERAAQAGGGEATLPAVNVRASAPQESARGPVPGYVARRSATGTRTDTPLKEVPQSISVISAEQVLEQNAQTLQEVLRYTAGVHADVYGLDNRGDWFKMRGGSDPSTLLDGLRLPLTGWYGVVRNEPYAFERIEVLRGPASVVAGQNGPGGVVNLVSKRPLAETRREIALQLGTDEHKQLAADLTGPLNEEGTLRYRLVALGRESETQVKHADIEREFVAPSLTWTPSAATEFTAYAEYQRDESGNTEGFFPLEGTLYSRPQGRIPIETFISEPGWDTYGGHRTRLGYAFRHQIDEAWTVRHDLRHDRVRGKLRSMYANYWEGYLEDGRSLNRTWYASNDKSRITNTDLMLEGKLAWGRTRHTVLAGVDGMRLDYSRDYWSGAATPLDVYSPVYGSFTPVLDAGTYSPANAGDTETRQYGFFLQDQMKIDDRWVVVAGLRRDYARNEVSGTGERSEDREWSKNLGLVYLAGAWSPYLSYSESFEAVAGRETTGVVYKPKRGRQVEAGVKWTPADPRITATAAVYKLREENRLTADPADPNNQIQKGEVEVKGLELEAAADLRAWDLIASYTYTDSEVSKSSDPADPTLGKRLPNVPEHMAKLWAVHKFGVYGLPQLRAGLGVRYVGKTWDDTNDLATPSHTLLDAMVSWDEGAWRYALNVTNLTDKTYLAACLARGDCWYGTKRKAVASVTYRW